jgi:hypothetical protein
MLRGCGTHGNWRRDERRTTHHEVSQQRNERKEREHADGRTLAETT